MDCTPITESPALGATITPRWRLVRVAYPSTVHDALAQPSRPRRPSWSELDPVMLGGVVPLFVCTLRAEQGGYSADDHQGVVNLARYWHFLGVVWVILFAVIELAQHR